MNINPLLDLIAKCESEGSVAIQGVNSSYDVVVRQAFTVYPPKVPITTMTVSNVLLWQSEAIKQYRQRFNTNRGYSAAGRYQIVKSTLKGLAGVCCELTDLFDEKTQDSLAIGLLSKRGLDLWLDGKISNDAFADAISQEWASLPFNTGYSYYAGDTHGNRSLISREKVIKTLQCVKEQ